MSISRVMAEMALNTKPEEITAGAYEAAKRLILDTIGTAISGYDAPGIQPIHELVAEWRGTEEAHVFVYGGRYPAPNAAFVNSSMIHALDPDDVHMPAILHIMSSVLPVTFAVGEMMRATGKDMMAAMVLGIEVAARIGIEHLRYRKHEGFLPASVDGGFGATASACRLLKLNRDQSVHAFGIFYAHASGNRQALFELTLTKRIQPAIAAKAALWAALLARKGITGPELAFEGDAGLFRIYGNGMDAIPKEENFLGDRGFFEIERTGIKKFPTCGAHHGAIQAALDLAVDNDLKPDQIDHVEYYIGEGGNKLVGRPFRIGSQPQVSAQFCAPYAIALALVRRKVSVANISDEKIQNDRETMDVAERTKILTHWNFDPNLNKEYEGYPPFFGRPQMVRVITKDGKEMMRTRNQGDVLHPDHMHWDDVVEKFRVCAASSRIWPSDKTETIIDAVKNFEAVTDASDFIESCLILR
jgi:2-methylcitrate dehydratase PrpD